MNYSNERLFTDLRDSISEAKIASRFKPNGITNNRKKWERKNALRKVKNFVDYHKQKAGELSEVVNKTPLSNKLTERIPNLGNTDFGFN
jgi:NifB/MoaA-like Fe-S oxidoreductase